MGTSVSGLFGIAADARLADFDFEDAEVAQFHLVALGQRFGDVVEGFLHHVENLLLTKPVSLLMRMTRSRLVRVIIFLVGVGSLRQGEMSKFG